MNEDDRRTPEIDMEDDAVELLEIEYSIRAPDDWVISGPLGDEGFGPGRWFASEARATMWARAFYGRRLKSRWTAPDGRWAFLIRGKGQTNG